MLWLSFFCSFVILLFSIAGNGLSVLLYEGYEWLIDYIFYSLFGVKDTFIIKAISWLLTGIVGIFDFILAFVWLLPMVVSMVFIVVTYFAPPEDDLSEGSILKKVIIENIGQIVKSVCVFVAFLSYPLVLNFMKTQSSTRLDIAETLVFSVAYFIAKIILVIVFMVCAFIIVCSLINIFNSINGMLAFFMLIGLIVSFGYLIYSYGTEIMEVHKKDVSFISFWWNYLDYQIIKGSTFCIDTMKSLGIFPKALIK